MPAYRRVTGFAGQLHPSHDVTIHQERAELFQRLFAHTGRPVRRSSVILDLGCGKGELVQAFIGVGLDAYGCDFAGELARPSERIRPLHDAPYRVPFEDHSFDYVVSDQVFEHVQDYQDAFAEIKRVLKPGGISLHLFPPRYSLREPHTLVPLGTVIQSRAWLSLWAAAGIRNEYQQDKSVREVATLNYEYLRRQTTYYSRRELLRRARRVFPRARLLERELLASRPGRRARAFAAAARWLPALATMWCEIRGRALLLT